MLLILERDPDLTAISSLNLKKPPVLRIVVTIRPVQVVVSGSILVESIHVCLLASFLDWKRKRAKRKRRSGKEDCAKNIGEWEEQKLAQHQDGASLTSGMVGKDPPSEIW